MRMEETEARARAAPQMVGSMPSSRSMDETRFTELVRLHDHDMARLCFLISGDAELARDAVQNTWERLWLRPPQLRDETKLQQWLLSVAVNEVRQMLRRRARGKDLERRVAEVSSSWDFPEGDWLDVGPVLKKLEPHERELLGLRYVIGLNSGEIAEILDLSPEGVRSRLHRLLERLRSQLDHE